MDYYSKLVCPICKTNLETKSKTLKCEKCKVSYPIVDNIPIFISPEEQKKWNDYHIEEYTPLLQNPKREDFKLDIVIGEESYSSAPFTEEDYYGRYIDDWKTMLDVGCGDGIFSAPMSNKVEDIYCVDPSFISLKRLLKRERQNMYPINADGGHLPFPNDFFDGVFFIFVLEHLKDPLPILSEIKRVLKPTGHLILSTDSKYYYRYFRILTELIRYRHYRPDDPTHVNLMTPNEVRNIIDNAGFITEKEYLRYFPQRLYKYYKIVPKFISEPFLTSIIIHKCHPQK